MNAVPQLRRRPATLDGALSVLLLMGALASLTAAAPSAVLAQDGARSGKEIVDTSCARCHATGAEGAPRIGDERAWAPRASQGLTSLTQHALLGIRNMPPHGGNPGLTDGEIERAIVYMVNRSGGNWVEPAGVGMHAAERSGRYVVQAQCTQCHAEGVGGAPQIGDRAAWTPRLTRGVDALVGSAIHGHGGMPPRGGQANLTDGELRAAILYMFDPDSAGARGAPRSAPVPVAASAAGYEQIVGGLRILLGYTSADALRGFPEGSVERTMHGGVPRGSGYFHLNVSLFDRRTNAPVAGARIEARVERPGLGGETMPLEALPLGNSSYGAYVRVMPRTAYRISLRIQTAESPAPVAATFRHTF